MSDSKSAASDAKSALASLTVENIGGIDNADVDLESGITILTGRNGTNRTSFLSALGGVLGGTTASLKSDAKAGSISLDLNGNTYRQEYERTATGTQVAGTPFVENKTLIDLGVALFEDNPARRAVERGDDLRDVIMRPVDIDEIRARIRDLTERKHSIEDRIERVTRRRTELSELECEKTEIMVEIETIESSLADLHNEVGEYEADLAAAEEAADVVAELDTRRQELNSLSETLEMRRAERDALREDIENVEAELEDLPANVADTLESLDDDLETARRRKNDLDDTIASLTTIVDFNAELLNEDTDLPSVSTNEVTSGLAPEEHQQVVCWTCGSHVRGGEIDDRLDDLRAVIEEKRSDREDLWERLGDLRDRKAELEGVESHEVTLECRLDEMREKVTKREQTIEDVCTDREDCRQIIKRLEAEVTEVEDLQETDLLGKYERISELRYEQDQLHQQRVDIEERIDEIETLPAIDELESQQANLKDELARERDRISTLETDAVEAFNDHMSRLVDILEYDNIARAWLERTDPSDGLRSGGETTFELHIVRERADGTVYEDRLMNLSESEREVIGLVVALAGYLVHLVYETVPFMLLDSLEAIDSTRISDLVEYFATHAPYLVIALLPEDAAALSDEYDRIPADTLST